MADDAQNKESMKEAIDTLEQITSSNSTQKQLRNFAITYLLPLHDLNFKNIHYV